MQDKKKDKYKTTTSILLLNHKRLKLNPDSIAKASNNKNKYWYIN